MRKLREAVMKEDWDFLLYDINGKTILAVAFFGICDYFRYFELDGKTENYNIKQLKEISASIRENSENYMEREISKSPIFEDGDE